MNRRMRNRTYGGVGGLRGDPSPYPIGAARGVAVPDGWTTLGTSVDIVYARVVAVFAA